MLFRKQCISRIFNSLSERLCADVRYSCTPQLHASAARLSCTPQLHHNAAACVPQLHHTGREGHAGKGQKQRGGGGLGRRRSGGEGRGWERRGEKGRRGKGEERGGVVYASLHYNAFVCKHIQTYKTCKCLMFRGKLMCSNC